MIDSILENKDWLFSGLGASFLGILYKLLKSKNNIKHKLDQNDNSINNNNNININIETTESKISQLENNFSPVTPSISKKDIVHILFVDDEKFEVVTILKSAGWKNTKLKKDITDLDDQDVSEAHIIFVDINGVGTKLFKDQGLGLAKALKEKYPTKKVVIYSAENTGDMFNKSLKTVDDTLSKNAEPYEFVTLISSFAEEIFG